MWLRASCVAQLVKNLSPMQETWVWDLGSIPEFGRSPREGKDYPFQYSGLENSMDSPWGRRVRHDWVTFTFTNVTRIDVFFFFKLWSSHVNLEVNILNIKGLPQWLSGNESTCNAGDTEDMGSKGVWKMTWRRAWRPTPVYFPGESHG